MSKLPHITLAFWVMKICATTLGETAGDLLSMTVDLGYAVSSIIYLTLFAVALFFQLRAKSFKPWLYWTVIMATSLAGTTMSDFMDRTLGLGYAKGSLLLVSLLVGILSYWKWSEKSISVDTVRSRKAEVLYWMTILISNTLGTALGDYLADDSGLGFMGGALLIASTIALIAVLGRFTTLSKVALFWAAFVLTRPFGATMGDVLTKAPAKGGLGLGTVGSSLVLLGILVAVIYVTSRPKPPETASQ